MLGPAPKDNLWMAMRAAMGVVKYLMVFERPPKVKHHCAMGPVYVE